MSDSLDTPPDLERALARLADLIDWERSDRRADMGRSLGPVRDLLQRLGDPQRSFRTVHVAGTKGKSTTASFIAAGLQAAGFRTGSYSSPHVERVNERVRIGGEEIESGRLARSIEAALDARAELPTDAPAARTTYFDVLTAAAFRALREAEVEWAIIECGLGGRLDSTNAVRGDVCVITTIDLEHTEVLGETRALIAAEKAGILKSSKSSLVTGVSRDSEAGRVIHEAAARFSCPEIWVEPRAAWAIEERNAAVARAVLEELGRRGLRTADDRRVDASFLDEVALHQARLPGRQEFFSVPLPSDPSCPAIDVALDGGHVASSIAEWLKELPEPEIPSVAVLALRSDKDAEAVLKTLSSAVDTVLCTSLDDAPFFSAEDLATRARGAGLSAEAIAKPEAALERALEIAARRGALVLVLGSLYLCGRLRPVLRGLADEDPE